MTRTDNIQPVSSSQTASVWFSDCPLMGAGGFEPPLGVPPVSMRLSAYEEGVNPPINPKTRGFA